jgi:hypothetical protein
MFDRMITDDAFAATGKYQWILVCGVILAIVVVIYHMSSATVACYKYYYQ